MQPLQGQVGELQSFGSGAGEDGMAMFEKSIQGTAEAIIVEFVSGQVPEDVGASSLSPGWDID